MTVAPQGKGCAFCTEFASCFFVLTDAPGYSRTPCPPEVSDWPAVNTSVGTDPISALNAKQQMYTDVLDDVPLELC